MAKRILPILFILSALMANASSVPHKKPNVSMQIPLLRLKLVLDANNYDDIAIGFWPAATTAYNNQLDSRYMPGINAPEGLSCYSSDNVPLSINIVPLPSLNPLVIRLDVEAENSGPFTLERTELDSIPQVYDVWLMDKYAKDSLNLRSNTDYAFNVNKRDTASFGSNRFTVVIRQNPALMLHLLSFSAKKGSTGNDLTWTTENEQNTTLFSVERSIDSGKTFFMLDSVASNGSGAYSYTDNRPMNGDDLYRLKIQDLNGVITYSNIVSIDDLSAPSAQETSAVNIYPNPSNGPITLSINTGSNSTADGNLQTDATGKTLTGTKAGSPSSYDIRIMNIRGAVVKSATSSSTSWKDNLGSLPPGTYIVQVISSENKVVGRSTFVKL